MSSTKLGISGKEFDALLKGDRTPFRHFYDPDGCGTYSIFYLEVKPVYAYSLNFAELKPTTAGGNSVSFGIEDSFDFLMYVFADIKIPEMRIKPEHADTYEFCFTHNSAQMVMHTGVLKIDGREIQTIDHHYMMGDDGYLRKPGFSDTYEEISGNNEDLIVFSTRHRSYNLNPLHPFFLARHPGLSLPLCRLPSDSKVTFTYTLTRNLSEIIRIRRRVGENEQYIKMGDMDLRSILDGYPGDGMLELPKLNGSMCRITDGELILLGKEMPEAPYYIESVVSHLDTNERTYGQIATCSPKTDYPCKAIFVLLENVNSTRLNNHTNYSTSIHDPMSGDHPVEYIEMNFGNDRKFRFPPTYITGPLAIMHFSSSPKRKGIYALPFAFCVPTPGIEMGQLLKSLEPQLSAKIVDPPLFAIGENNGEPAPSFKMHVRSLCVREIKFGMKTPFEIVG